LPILLPIYSNLSIQWAGTPTIGAQAMLKRYIVLVRKTLKKVETYASCKPHALEQVAYAEQQQLKDLVILEVLPC